MVLFVSRCLCVVVMVLVMMGVWWGVMMEVVIVDDVGEVWVMVVVVGK